MDGDSISIWLGILFIIILFVWRIKTRKMNVAVFVELLSVYLLGIMIYPGINIIRYGLKGMTFYNEPITAYKIYIALAGILLIMLSFYSFVGILRRKINPFKPD